MSARNTKLIIYKNGIKVDSLYSSAAFTSIDELQEFLKKKGYSNFLDSELEYILENQEAEGDSCCQALTPITPRITLSTVSDTYVDLLVSNYDDQEGLNTYYLEVITEGAVVQTLPITSTAITIEGLDTGVIYTFKVYSVTCSATVYSESTAQTLPITVQVIVVGLGSSSQSSNNDETHTVSSGSDFTIEFDGGVFNNTELWYVDSIIRDTANITSSATVTSTISTKIVDGSIVLSNILQSTVITITFVSRYAEWCTDTSCIACNETSETATLNTLYVREDGLEVAGSPFTVLDGTTAATLANTYFISLELATILIDNRIVDSEGICCFDDAPELSNLETSLVGTASFVYTFESDPVVDEYSVVIRKQPTNVGVQSKTITALTDTITGLDDGADYTISITGSNCGGTNFISTSVTTEVLCAEFAPELNPVEVVDSSSGSITVSLSCVQEYLGVYTLQLTEVQKGTMIQAVSSGPTHTFTDLPVAGGEYSLLVTVSNCNGIDSSKTTVQELPPVFTITNTGDNGYLRVEYNDAVVDIAPNTTEELGILAGSTVTTTWGIVDLDTGLLDSDLVNLTYPDYSLPARISSVEFDGEVPLSDTVDGISDENGVIKARSFTFTMETTAKTAKVEFRELDLLLDYDFENPYCVGSVADTEKVVTIKDRVSNMPDITQSTEDLRGTKQSNYLSLIGGQKYTGSYTALSALNGVSVNNMSLYFVAKTTQLAVGDALKFHQTSNAGYGSSRLAYNGSKLYTSYPAAQGASSNLIPNYANYAGEPFLFRDLRGGAYSYGSMNAFVAGEYFAHTEHSHILSFSPLIGFDLGGTGGMDVYRLLQVKEIVTADENNIITDKLKTKYSVL